MNKNEKETIKQATKSSGTSTQAYLKIAEIRDNTLILKNGGLRAVLETSSVNFNLKSEPEQKSLIYSYQNFLNSLDFPIQLLVRSRKLDIDHYLDHLKSVGAKQQNQLLQKQTYEYVEYIERLIEYADIMEKRFYVIIPQNPYRSQKVNMFKQFWNNIHPKDSVSEIKRRHKEFENLKKELMQKVNIGKSGLSNIGLSVKELNTKDLIELFYNIYNPSTSRNQKLNDINQQSIVTDEDLLEAEKEKNKK